MATIYDLVVCGNGIVGLSIAFESIRRGMRTAVIGPIGRDKAASTASGAMLGCFGEVTRLTESEEHGRLKLTADLKARELWPDWVEAIVHELPSDPGLVNSEGTFVVLNSIGDATVDSGNFEAIRRTLVREAEPFSEVEPASIPWINPDPLSRPLEALHIPGEKSVNSAVLLASLLTAIERMGGTIVDDHVERVDSPAVGTSVIHTVHSGEFVANSVVMAMGAETETVVRASFSGSWVDRIPPLFSGYGVSLLVDNPAPSVPRHVVRTPNRAFACGLHLVPRSDGTVYLGGTNVVVSQSRRTATIRDLEFLLNCAVFQLHRGLPQSGVTAVQVGNRPVPADGFPLIGKLPSTQTYIATGTYRDGLQQSPLVANYIVDILKGGASVHEELFMPFAPVRRPIEVSTRASIVQMATDELLAAAYETHWTVRPEWPDMLRALAAKSFASKAESIHASVTPPPDVLAKADERMVDRLRLFYAAWGGDFK